MNKHLTPSPLYNFVFLLFFLIFSSFSLPHHLRYEKRSVGECNVHILEVDPELAAIKVVRARESDPGVDTVSNIAKKHNALAAINGSFFELKEPFVGISSGVLKVGGEFYFCPQKERGAIGWKEKPNIVLIDRLKMQAELLLGEKSYPIDGINRPRKDQESVLYTSHFSSSTFSQTGVIELAIGTAGTPLFIHLLGNTMIPPNGFVYSMGIDAPFRLPNPFFPGCLASFTIFLEPLNHPENTAEWQEVDNIFSGTPILIDAGRIADFCQEKIKDSFIHNRHPRTAIGITETGKWIFVVADGRIPGSAGMNLMELAHFMKNLGCSYALNLDGGGSSTLYLAGALANTPCGGHENDEQKIGMEMPVGDVFLIFDKESSLAGKDEIPTH